MKLDLLNIVLVLSLLCGRAEGAEIRLRAAADCEGSVIRLADVAEVLDVQQQQRQSLEQLRLGVAPPLGQLQIITRGQIREAMTAAGIEPTRHDFRGAAETKVTSRNLLVPEKTLHPVGDAATQTDARQLTITAHPATPRPVAAAEPTITQTAAVTPRLVAARAMKRGQVLSPADMRLEPAGAVGEQGELLRHLQDLVGWEVTRAVAAGEPLYPDDLRLPVLVRKRDLVTVLVRVPAAGVKIQTTGVALDEGTRGDIVKVQPLGGKQEFYFAQVSAARQVELIVPGSPDIPQSAPESDIQLLQLKSAAAAANEPGGTNHR